MPPLTFAKAQGMAWEGNEITDHNRSEINIDNERIEDSKRMANGTLRKYVVADKRKISTSWENLPATTANTVDGFWGGRDMRAFYLANAGEFDLTLNYGDGTTETITVVFTSFNHSVDKRSDFDDLWSVDVEMEEV